MRFIGVMALVALVALVACAGRDGGATKSSVAKPAPLDLERIAQAAGSEATAADGGVVRIGWSRTDVALTVDGVALPPAAGLGSWAAFAPIAGGAMVMGDTVVFEDEINPAIDAAFAHGLTVTALHNHFAFDDPPVYFMHIGGHGDAETLAAGVRAMWDAIKAVRTATPVPVRSSGGTAVVPGSFDGDRLSAIIGHPVGAKPGGVMKVVIEREAEMSGLRFAGNMGLTTWAAFTGADAMATIDGDFAMTADEVEPVLRALRAARIQVVALHNHMIGETPAYYFVHFWGKGAAASLAEGFRAALDAQRAVSPKPHH